MRCSRLPTDTLLLCLLRRCDYDLSLYPFDAQTCELRYESFNYPSYLLHLFTETNEVNLEQYHESAEFSMVSTNATR